MIASAPQRLSKPRRIHPGQGSTRSRSSPFPTRSIDALNFWSCAIFPFLRFDIHFLGFVLVLSFLGLLGLVDRAVFVGSCRPDPL